MTIAEDVANRAPNLQTQDLRFAASAAREDADKIGWLVHSVYDTALLRNRLIVVVTNGDRVGFALWGHNPSTAELKLYQVWVRQDARLIINGRLLVAQANKHARELRATKLRCWVAEDLAANLFWKAIGFKKKAWRYGPARLSKRKHNLWVKQVSPSLGQSPILSTARMKA